MKICRRCQKSLPDDLFGVTRKRGKVYPRHVCKACTNGNRSAAAVPPAPTPDPVDSIEIDVDPVVVAVEEHTKAEAKRDLKREHTALVEELRRKDRLIAELGKLRTPEILIYEQPKWERADAVACAVASDWHVEEPVELASVHGLNAYDLEIAKARARKFFQHLLRLTNIFARETRIRKIHLSLLGDFFSGWIHEELAANNLLAPGEAAHFVQSLLCEGIQFLLDNSEYEIVGDCLPGNHGRMTHQVHHGNPTGTSLETYMYHHVADYFRNEPRVRLQVSTQSMVYRHFFEKFKMRLIHGYEVKYGGGVGGITIPIRKALAQWNNPIRADLTVMGHFHQFFDGGDFLVNGSLIGYNTFAQAIKASYEEARQAFFLVHARNGGEKSVTAPIWLDDRHHEKAAPPAVPSL